MTDERLRRVGHNQALYRQVNERIENVNEVFGAPAETFEIVCECGDLGCMEQITVPREVYERTRSSPNRFILQPGHDAQDLEDVVERAARYVVVEKAPAARGVAEETDPRS